MFRNDAEAVKTRLGYCSDILDLQDHKIRLGDISGIPLIRFNKRLNTLRGLLVGQTVPIADALLVSNEQAKNYIAKMLKTYKSELDPAKKAKLLLELKNFIDVQYAAWSLERTTSSFKLFDEKKEVETLVDNTTMNIDALIKKTANESKIKDIFDVSAAQKLIDHGQEVTKRHTDEVKVLNSELVMPEFDKSTERVVALRMEMHKLIQASLNDDESQRYYTEYSAKIDEERTKFKEFRESILGEKNKALNDELTKVYNQKVAMAQAVKDAVISQSSVTQDDAEKWLTENVTITKAVKNKMKKNGITPEKFQKDLKDFFVITNGRLGKITIDTKNHDRAYATDVQTHYKEGVVMLDNRFEQHVLWHELAHHLEADDTLRLMAKQYIKSRSLDGGKLHKLRNLTGNKGFRSDEIAYHTDMFSHYVAKVYRHEDTEVFSMGVEAFYNPEKLFLILKDDPKTLEFVSAALMLPKAETDVINKQMRDSILDNNADAKDAQTDQIQESFNQLVKLVSWSDSTDFKMSDLTDGDRAVLEEYFNAVPFASAILPDGRKFVLLRSGKVKFKAFRGRAMKGVIALDMQDYKREGFTYFTIGRSIADQHAFAIQTQDIDKIKVMILSMDMNKGVSYSIADTKGILGEGYLATQYFEKIKKHYLKG